MSTGGLPIDPRECTDRFRAAARDAGAALSTHPIDARAPDSGALAIDIAVTGSDRPERALVVLSGVHGVEAFAPSEAQRELIARLAARRLPDDLAVVLVHGVNPWGMIHGRRQNESNVDLNRNWRRSDGELDHHAAYDEIHHIVCPERPPRDGVPPFDELLAQLAPFVEERGTAWVADAITRGQYRHPDGLHYGGSRTEASCLILERTLPPLIGSASNVLVVDLHTGHGPYAEMAYLSTAPVGSAADAFLRSAFGPLESSDAGDVNAKSGQIARGIADLAPVGYSITAEVGTTSDLEQLAAAYHEQWLFRCAGGGDPDDADHVAARRRFRETYTPDDEEWVAGARSGLRSTLDAALAAVVEWT